MIATCGKCGRDVCERTGSDVCERIAEGRRLEREAIIAHLAQFTVRASDPRRLIGSMLVSLRSLHHWRVTVTTPEPAGGDETSPDVAAQSVVEDGR